MSSICGIDFGTSNSTVGIAKQGKPLLVPLEAGQAALPSALFFNFDDSSVSYGRAAVSDYIDGEFGRLMRALKSILGTSLMNQGTHIRQRRVHYSEIIGEYIAELKQRAESHAQQPLSQLVAGRPVHFVDNDPNADKLAQDALAEIYQRAGFKDIEFQFEPIAAALDYEQQLKKEELALIVDIGGGTADFTIIRLAPCNQHKSERYDDILATSGVHIGGNDFDQRFNLAKAMPALGLHSYMKGSSRLQLPSAPYFDLATWHLIHNQYERQNIHRIETLKLQAEQPKLIDRLLTLLKQQDGHRLIAQVEACKIALSGQQHTELELDFIEDQLRLPCHREEFEAATKQQLEGICHAIQQTLLSAQISAKQISSVFLTGGTTGLPALRHAVATLFPDSECVEGDRFGSVGTGLTLDALRRFA